MAGRITEEQVRGAITDNVKAQYSAQRKKRTINTIMSTISGVSNYGLQIAELAIKAREASEGQKQNNAESGLSSYLSTWIDNTVENNPNTDSYLTDANELLGQMDEAGWGASFFGGDAGAWDSYYSKNKENIKSSFLQAVGSAQMTANLANLTAATKQNISLIGSDMYAQGGSFDDAKVARAEDWKINSSPLVSGLGPDTFESNIILGQSYYTAMIDDTAYSAISTMSEADYVNGVLSQFDASFSDVSDPNQKATVNSVRKNLEDYAKSVYANKDTEAYQNTQKKTTLAQVSLGTLESDTGRKPTYEEIMSALEGSGFSYGDDIYQDEAIESILSSYGYPVGDIENVELMSASSDAIQMSSSMPEPVATAEDSTVVSNPVSAGASAVVGESSSSVVYWGAVTDELAEKYGIEKGTRAYDTLSDVVEALGVSNSMETMERNKATLEALIASDATDDMCLSTINAVASVGGIDGATAQTLRKAIESRYTVYKAPVDNAVSRAKSYLTSLNLKEDEKSMVEYYLIDNPEFRATLENMIYDNAGGDIANVANLKSSEINKLVDTAVNMVTGDMFSRDITKAMNSVLESVGYTEVVFDSNFKGKESFGEFALANMSGEYDIYKNGDVIEDLKVSLMAGNRTEDELLNLASMDMYGVEFKELKNEGKENAVQLNTYCAIAEWGQYKSTVTAITGSYDRADGGNNFKAVNIYGEGVGVLDAKTGNLYIMDASTLGMNIPSTFKVYALDKKSSEYKNLVNGTTTSFSTYGKPFASAKYQQRLTVPKTKEVEHYVGGGKGTSQVEYKETLVYNRALNDQRSLQQAILQLRYPAVVNSNNYQKTTNTRL